MNRCTIVTGTGWDAEVCYKPVFRSRSRCFDHGLGKFEILAEMMTALIALSARPRRLQ